ncbi:hypothetical protein [Reyranella sp.]|uniref:hypothetical protein n=1 Tax=Reyranella sp. TaxID=1929291 RepID=UPI003F72E67F
MDYQVVYPANAGLVMDEGSWPAPANPVRTAFLESEDGKTSPNATPRFILFQDGKIVLTVTGNGDWKDRMWPRIQEVTATKA